MFNPKHKLSLLKVSPRLTFFTPFRGEIDRAKKKFDKYFGYEGGGVLLGSIHKNLEAQNFVPLSVYVYGNCTL
jgi:hypothetical protein